MGYVMKNKSAHISFGIALRTAPVGLAMLLSLVLSGCSATHLQAVDTLAGRDAVMPIKLGIRAFVRPDAMAKGLIEAGLPSDQVMEYGPHMMEMIATEGGAELYLSGRLTYALAVFGGDLFITSMDQGLTLVRDAV